MANSPSLAKPGRSAAKFGDLRRRAVFLLLALVVYRIGAHIPVPGIDPDQLAKLFQSQSGGILGMTRSTKRETSSRSDVGPIAADASSKSRRRKANPDLQRKRCNGSPDCMRSSRGSRITHPTSNMRRGKPRRCRCSNSSGNGWRATSSVCRLRGHSRKPSAMHYVIGQCSSLH